MSIFDKVKEYCKQNDISLRAFEQKCDLGNGTIKGWEKSHPRIDSLQKVAKEMNTTIEKLLEKEAVKK